MKLITFISIIWISYFLMGSLQAKTQEDKQVLYIGIEKNRKPFIINKKDQDQDVQGILIDRVKYLCKKIKVECKFIKGDFSHLLEQLRTFKIHAVANVDTFILADIERIKLTPKLCKLTPVFIQKNPNNIKEENFIEMNMGVRKHSNLHFYLIDKYSNANNLKPFRKQINGLFDLETNNLDILFSNKSFFLEGIKKTSLGKNYNFQVLNIKEEDKHLFPDTSIRFILRENDIALYEKLTNAIHEEGNPPYCEDLLKSKD